MRVTCKCAYDYISYTDIFFFRKTLYTFYFDFFKNRVIGDGGNDTVSDGEK